MKISTYLDSTYLKTPEQSGLSEQETLEKVLDLTLEAISHDFFSVMIRPDYVKAVRAFLSEKPAAVKIGTVIGFHEGTSSTEEKLQEAQKAIEDGADELDFVINYEAYKKGDLNLVKNEFVKGSQLSLENGKIVKWIIEIAALTDAQIADFTQNISAWAEENFKAEELGQIFVKSSTGFYETEGGKPNGATVEGIKIMLAHAGRLLVKAAGGIKNPQEAAFMIDLGVKRIGTSSAKSLINNDEVAEGY